MDVLKAITGRYSVRNFHASRLVPNELVATLVQCGCHAPSSKDAQPWRFHVVRSWALRQRFAALVGGHPDASNYVPLCDEGATYESSVHESARIIGEAEILVFVENLALFGGGRRAAGQSPHPDASLVSYALEVIGIGAAIQNILLAAHALGLGAVFIGDALVAEEEIRTHLGMSGELMGVIAIGHAAGPRFAPKRLHPDRIVMHD